MAIKSSGQLSFTEIVAEFADTAPYSMSEFYRNGGKVPSNNTNVPTSGAISFSNFYNAVNRITISVTISSDTTNYTISPATLASYGYVSGITDVTLTINSNVFVYSTSTSNAGLTVGSFASGDTVTINNYGYIMGMGGAGGSTTAVVGDPAYWGAVGNAGGNALELNYSVTVWTYQGNYCGLFGGGGGGGSSGKDSYMNYTGTLDRNFGQYYGFTGGGGGAGGGAGGGGVNVAVGGSGGAPGQSGTNGSGSESSANYRDYSYAFATTIGSSQWYNGAWSYMPTSGGGGGGRVVNPTTTTGPARVTLSVGEPLTTSSIASGYGGSGGGTGAAMGSDDNQVNWGYSLVRGGTGGSTGAGGDGTGVSAPLSKNGVPGYMHYVSAAGGGGGYGQAGGASKRGGYGLQYFNDYHGDLVTHRLGGAAGKAVKTNGYSVTFSNTPPSLYGAVA